MQSILAVDDSPSMRKMVTFTLTSAGFNVVEAVDGEDAQQRLQGNQHAQEATDSSGWEG